jgi:hypothetical protein
MQSLCRVVPITTHAGHATTRPGILPENHVVVYAWGQTPELTTTETGVTKPAFMVFMSPNTTYFSDAARIDFARAYTIAYNVEAKDIGIVQYEQLPLLAKCWLETQEDVAKRSRSYLGPDAKTQIASLEAGREHEAHEQRAGKADPEADLEGCDDADDVFVKVNPRSSARSRYLYL